MNILKFWRRAKNQNVCTEEQKERKPKYPLEELGRYVGKTIEVKYISCDIPKIESGILKFYPNDEFFYLGHEDGYHIVHWDRRDINNREDKVLWIKDENGNIIYQRPERNLEKSCVTVI